jgi:hypothetical protein
MLVGIWVGAVMAGAWVLAGLLFAAGFVDDALNPRDKTIRR